MANALPHAIGAQASQPGRQVVALSGDGGLAMLLGELITLRQQQLPVKIVVFNNGALSFVELEMKAAGIPTFGTDLLDPDFAGIARAAGLFGARVEKASELEDALRAAFAHDGPALVDVRTARQELSLPPKLTYGRSRASPCTRPGPSCPVRDQNSSSSPRPTCGNWRSNDHCVEPRGAARAGAVDAAERSPELAAGPLRRRGVRRARGGVPDHLLAGQEPAVPRVLIVTGRRSARRHVGRARHDLRPARQLRQERGRRGQPDVGHRA
jgi:hypothetical protein